MKEMIVRFKAAACAVQFAHSSTDRIRATSRSFQLSLLIASISQCHHFGGCRPVGSCSSSPLHQTSNPAVGNFLEFAPLIYSFQTSRCFGTGLALITVRKKISPMKNENPILAALVLIGTSLLARMAAQGVKQALFSTAMEYCLNARRRKLRSVRSGR